MPAPKRFDWMVMKRSAPSRLEARRVVLEVERRAVERPLDVGERQARASCCASATRATSRTSIGVALRAGLRARRSRRRARCSTPPATTHRRLLRGSLLTSRARCRPRFAAGRRTPAAPRRRPAGRSSRPSGQPFAGAHQDARRARASRSEEAAPQLGGPIIAARASSRSRASRIAFLEPSMSPLARSPSA